MNSVLTSYKVVQLISSQRTVKERKSWIVFTVILQDTLLNVIIFLGITCIVTLAISENLDGCWNRFEIYMY